MLVGYSRVSTNDQNLDLQNDALSKAGCEKLFSDKASGAKATRPGLDEALDYVRQGDTLVVWKLDRLGRSLQHLIQTVLSLEEKGIGFLSLQERIDTSSPAGKLFFNIMASLAEFERDLIRERTNAGLAAARARGRVGGRKQILSETKVEQAHTLIQGGAKVSDVCATLKCSPRTLRRRLAELPIGAGTHRHG